MGDAPAPEFFPWDSETWEGQQLGNVRGLVEDFLVEWEDKARGELVEQVAGEMRDWLASLPPFPALYANVERLRELLDETSGEG